jgi:hypothetical protein
MPEPSSGFVVAVVDDDQGILRSLEYLLESADYAVRLFTSFSYASINPTLSAGPSQITSSGFGPNLAAASTTTSMKPAPQRSADPIPNSMCVPRSIKVRVSRAG